MEEMLVFSRLKQSQVGRLLKTMVDMPMLHSTGSSLAPGLPESAFSPSP